MALSRKQTHDTPKDFTTGRVGVLAMLAIASSLFSLPAHGLVSTPGAANVDSQGNSAFSIPIVSSPGTFGMKPDLSLVYSSRLSAADMPGPNRNGHMGSRGGNGPMGVGWSLSGLSSIDRCPQTLATDNTIGAIKLDSTDRFCLDGHRLVKIGTGIYGADLTEYRTEVETMTKVISYGTAGNGPAWFKVWTRSGLIKEYGNTDDSRVLATGTTTARSWAENKVTDRQSNYYTITYTQNASTGEHLPSRIDYTGNASAPLAPYNSIRFSYAARPDTEWYFVSTSKIQSENRLTNVQTFADATLAKDYRIAYDVAPNTARSRVSSITECGGDGTCLPPLNFSYLAGAGVITQSGGTPQSLPNMTHNGSAVASIAWGDFNGDGIQDAWIGGANGLYRICYGPTFTVAQCSAFFSGNGGAKAYIFDYNGDGLSDLAILTAAGNLQFCAGPDPLNNCVGAPYGTYPNHDFVRVDFGDGRDILVGWNPQSGSNGQRCDPLYMLGSGSSCAPLVGATPGTTRTTIRGDFDGDGRTDLIFVGATDYRVCSGQNIAAYSACSTVANAANWRDDATMVVGDFNGDSKSDLMLLTSSGLQFCPGPGLLFANNCTAVANTSGDWKTLYQAIPGDFNADGATDLMLASTTGTLFCAGPGITSTNSCMSVNSQDWRNAKLAAADFNGDSSADLMIGVGVAAQLAAGASSRPDLLSGATNGAFGTTTSFTYLPATNTTVYTKGSGTSYPMQETQHPFFLVSQMNLPNGIGGTNAFTYKYEKGRVSLDGRGFAGFETTRAMDVASNRETVSTWLQAYPHLGRRGETNVYIVGALVRKNVRTITTFNSFEGRSLSVVGQEIDASYGLDGSWASARHSYGYSVYGHVSGISTYYDELDSTLSPPKFKRIWSKSTTNSAADWLFEQPLSDVTQHFPAVGVQANHHRSFTPVPGTRLVQQEIRENSFPAFRVVTAYTRDAFGNVTGTTVTPEGMEARVASMPHDVRGQFATSITNPLGHVASQVIDARFGIPTSSTDPNNLTTSWQLDTFGRKTLETRPDGTQSIWAYEVCCTSNANNPYLAFRVASTVTGSSQPSYAYFDTLGRPVLSVRRNFADTGWIDEKNTWFNANGKVIRSYLPYDQGAANPPYVTSQYDTRGRLWKTIAPDGGLTTYIYSAQPNAGPITTSVIDARNFNTQYKRNVHGELIQVIDALGTTQYEYSPLGKVSKIYDAFLNQTTFTYDKYGSMLTRNDPDLGNWTFAYDPLGQLISQTDAKSQTTTFSYDKLGRATQRTEPSLTATWTWDSATKGVGKLASTSTNGTVTRSYLYDAVGRPFTQSLTVDGTAYPLTRGYDTAGRAETLTYPTGFATRNVYNSAGYLSEVRDNSTSALFWKVVASSPAGITDEDYGNGTGVARNFAPNTHRVTQIGTLRDSDGALLQNYTYGYDLVGNMTSRSETTQSVSETYAYDSVNRLTSVTGPASKTFTYSDIGNLLSKTGVASSFAYPASGKVHAVSGGGGISYTYDLNGNLLSAGTKSFTWKSFNMPATAQVGSATYSWAYDAERVRVKYDALGDSRTYVGAGISLFFEKVTTPGLTEQRHYIYAGSQPVAIHTQRSIGANDTRYFYRDHLGSTTLVLNESGNVTENLSYDVHGKRRFPSGSDDAGNTLSGLATDRGYTEHEHLDELGLIHMNGRLYDVRIGRFLSPDPVYWDSANPQSLNRYSYVIGNPLRYVDPTGYSIGEAGTDERTVWVDPQKIVVEGTRIPTDRPPPIYRPGDFLRNMGASGGPGGRESGEESAPTEVVRCVMSGAATVVSGPLDLLRQVAGSTGVLGEGEQRMAQQVNSNIGAIAWHIYSSDEPARWALGTEAARMANENAGFLLGRGAGAIAASAAFGRMGMWAGIASIPGAAVGALRQGTEALDNPAAVANVLAGIRPGQRACRQ